MLLMLVEHALDAFVSFALPLSCFLSSIYLAMLAMQWVLSSFLSSNLTICCLMPVLCVTSLVDFLHLLADNLNLRQIEEAEEGDDGYIGVSDEPETASIGSDGPLYDTGDDMAMQIKAVDPESDTESDGPLYDTGDDYNAVPSQQAVEGLGGSSDVEEMLGFSEGEDEQAESDQLYDNTATMDAPTAAGDEISESSIGRRVRVQGYDCPGTLRFFGTHVVKGGLRCGVELDEPVGLNNGVVGGHVYFTCEAKHGVLTAPHKVTLL
eukprot:m.341894 g.341894  ORF g.341894 m.341894 type:complete len:265 (+) comp16115_c0_seq12:36-830(+)